MRTRNLPSPLPPERKINWETKGEEERRGKKGKQAMASAEKKSMIYHTLLTGGEKKRPNEKPFVINTDEDRDLIEERPNGTGQGYSEYILERAALLAR